ncbi:hypothetical protein Tdes44962_MAKER10040 [Teratosphaeria destructans]|uniref:Uncharacterized protein n=1 Tax=Teratosphaeria destructans TaxID=418781 RepID=A0A9W7W1J6_9PEZI|nr:hypothetical protein Tdes44962_MAKER10040 [Teratosphaeria destructans]
MEEIQLDNGLRLRIMLNEKVVNSLGHGKVPSHDVSPYGLPLVIFLDTPSVSYGQRPSSHFESGILTHLAIPRLLRG